jgi:endogenous inhibitor of DNA gyrase (YacG/DUF329 family)
VCATLDALVEESYQRALDRGAAITSPVSWRAWKRSVYIATAKREGAGYLRKHYQRLGLGTIVAKRVKCIKCDGDVIGHPVTSDAGDAPFCSYQCAGIETMTLAQWIETKATPEQREAMQRIKRVTEDIA